MSLQQPVNILLLPSLGGRDGEGEGGREGRGEKSWCEACLVRMRKERRGRALILFIAWLWRLWLRSATQSGSLSSLAPSIYSCCWWWGCTAGSRQNGGECKVDGYKDRPQSHIRKIQQKQKVMVVNKIIKWFLFQASFHIFWPSWGLTNSHWDCLFK